MITLVVDGHPQERLKFAKQLTRDLQTSGDIAVLYEEGFPRRLPIIEPDVIVVVSDTTALRG